MEDEITKPGRRADEARSLRSAPGDMKAGLTTDRPRLSIVPLAGELYQCRAMEYGADKYRRGNYHGSPPEGSDPAARVMGYVDAAMRHLRAVADAYNRAFADRGDGTDASGAMVAALCTPDVVASGGLPASGLPHLAHAMASVALAVQCGVDDGLLPADPGQPWRAGRAAADDRSPEEVGRLRGTRDPEKTMSLEEAEPLWHGYRRADVLVACDATFDCLAPYEFKGEHLWNRTGLAYIDTPGARKELRDYGLRRPDEPDYKPLD